MNIKYTVAIVMSIALLIVLIVTQGHPQNLFEKHDINRLQSDLLDRTKADFGGVNSKILADYGFNFSTPTRDAISCYNSRDSMDEKHDDTCLVSNDAEPIEANDAFVAKWRKNSPAFEGWLLQNGWHKTWNEHQPIAEILDKPQNETSIGVNYDRN